MPGQIIERGKNNFVLCVYMGRDANGKRHYLNRPFHGGKKQATELLTKLLRDRDTGALVEPVRTTVSEYLDDWLEKSAKSRVRSRTYDFRRSHHSACVAALKRLPAAPLLTTWPCFTEAMYLLGSVRGYSSQAPLGKLRSDRRLIRHDLTAGELDQMATLRAGKAGPKSLAAKRRKTRKSAGGLIAGSIEDEHEDEHEHDETG